MSKLFIWVFACCFPLAALAWDAGPAECKENACSGGREARKVPDTQPKYADSVIPGRLANCPAGYTNIGIGGCGRGADTFHTPSVLPSCPNGYTNGGPAGCFPNGVGGFFGKWLGPGSFACPAGYFKDSVVQRCHKNCPDGYTQSGESCDRIVSTLGPSSFICGPNERRGGGLVANKCFPSTASNPGPCSEDREEYGISGASLCFKKCPAGSTRSALSTCVHDVKFRGNTHLFVVQNALTLLRSSTEPSAQKAVGAMSVATCAKQWMKGLWDADDGALADSPSGASGSHFYNGIGRDAQGNTTSVVTYTDLLAGGKDASGHGNARESAKKRMANAGKLGEGSVSDQQCYELGVALHYMTDMTQPMHATAFSGYQTPFFLHPVLEDYVPFIQGRYPASGAWDRRWAGYSADDVFHQTAVKSGQLAPELMKAFRSDGTVCTIQGQKPDSDTLAKLSGGGAGAGALLGSAGGPAGALGGAAAGSITGAMIASAIYTGKCFLNDAAVHEQIGIVLRNAYQATASYLFAAFGGTATSLSAPTISTSSSSAVAGLEGAVIATYAHTPAAGAAQNDWHIGVISRDGQGLFWRNRAGSVWRLMADPQRMVLVSGPDNPYFGSHPELGILVQGGFVSGLRINGETYARVGPVTMAKP